MKKCIFAFIIAAFAAPAFSFAATVPNTAAPAVASDSNSAGAQDKQDSKKNKHMKKDAYKSAATATAASPTKNAEKTGVKNCNPQKSKPCGNACIPLSRTCHK